MNWELILTIVSGVVTVLSVVLGYYQYIKKKIEQEALNAINKAEDTDKVGQEKMKEAVQTVYSLIPVVARPFISEKLVEMIIQNVFDKVEEYAHKQLEKDKNN